MCSRFTSLFIRLIIIIFWSTLFILFLYLPHVASLFRSERSLSIFTWSALIDPVYLKRFEQETGIKLYISYYESNEELLSKIEATQGRGYDIIIPSDYMLVTLKKKGYLKKIDKKRLPFFDDLDPKLLNHYFDPSNEYSIPYFWAVYGLGVDSSYFGENMPPATWGLIFDPALMPSRVGMTDNIREAIYTPSLYLFGSIEALKDPENLEKVKHLLIEQKKHVEIYSEVRSGDLLLSKACPVVFSLSSEIYRVSREDPLIQFIIPEEGSFLNIDSIVLPVSTRKDDLIYKFINYLYKKEVFAHHAQKYGLCPTLKDIESKNGVMFCPSSQFDKLHFIKDVVSKRKLNEIWLSVMAS